MAVFEGTFTRDPSLFRFAIVIARFNDLVTEKLLSGCQDCLKRHGIDINPQGTQVDYIWVPGCFEVPMVARQMAISRRYDGVFASGQSFGDKLPISIMWRLKRLKALLQQLFKLEFQLFSAF